MAKKTPALSEFIDLDQRRRATRNRGGFPSMPHDVTVAVYKGSNDMLTLTVRFSDDTATKFRLAEGQRLKCMIHPDQSHIALSPSTHARKGARLFRPDGSRALVYQTTLRKDMLEPQKATPAKIEEEENALIVTVQP